MVEDKQVWHDTAVGVVAAIRRAAKQKGYAIAWHGSLVKDIDLLAAPWTENAAEPQDMVNWVCESVGLWRNPDHKEQNPMQKPHGRQAWALHVLGTPVWVDFSVMPLLK